MPLRPPAGFISAFYDPLKNPNAPTIGTSSIVSATSISVAFTAPANIGGSAISSYLVTTTKTSDGSIVYTTGASSPVSVTGLTTGSAYTSKVLANNSYGPSVNSASSNSVSPTDPVVFSYLVVAGGGGGGDNRGGGGGAGGFRSGTSSNYFSGQSFTVTVGAGGTYGSNSAAFDITSIGGGKGGNFDGVGNSGGSGGGGGGGNSTLSGGSATSGQGNNGGSNGGYTGSKWASGGGGGAGSVGSNASSTSTSGNGGSGAYDSLSGGTYAGGGGGGIDNSGTAGSGGSGGGGAGSNTDGANGTNGTANTGGGGGGNGDNAPFSGPGSLGGSGIVILRTPDTAATVTVGAGLTYSLTTSGGYKTYTFTAGTGTVTV